MNGYATPPSPTSGGPLAPNSPPAVRPRSRLRAIARDLGMTAPAIYRYFPSLDALIAQVVADLLTELREMVVAARDRVPVTDPVTRLAEMARAFRRWALANRPSSRSCSANGSPALEAIGTLRHRRPHEASIRLGQLFLAELLALWRRYRPTPRPPAEQRAD